VGGTSALRGRAAILLVGLVIWAWHWLRLLASRDHGTTLWFVFVFLIGVLPGVALTVSPAGVLLYRGLQWILHASLAPTASAHFAGTPALVAAAITGIATWGYHRALIPDERAATTEPQRIYRYLVAGAGLLTL